MLGLRRYEVASPSSGTDRAYEYCIRCPGNKADQKQLPSHVLMDYLGRGYWIQTDTGVQDCVALWKIIRILAMNGSGEGILVLKVWGASYLRALL
jgi:hypothetical protein